MHIVIMKKTITLTAVLSLLILAFGCQENQVSPSAATSEKGTWRLEKISGGFAGLDEEILDLVTWHFDPDTQTMTVTYAAGIKFGGLDAGSYQYEVNDIGSSKYMVLDDSEFGGMSIVGDQLSIDQNMRSGGTGADGFVFELRLVSPD